MRHCCLNIWQDHGFGHCKKNIRFIRDMVSDQFSPSKKNKRKCKAMCLYVKWVCRKAGPRRFKCLEMVRPRYWFFSSPHSTANKSMFKVSRIHQIENCEQFCFRSVQMQICAVEFWSHEFQLFALLCARSSWKLRSWKNMGLNISGVLTVDIKVTK